MRCRFNRSACGVVLSRAAAYVSSYPCTYHFVWATIAAAPAAGAASRSVGARGQGRDTKMTALRRGLSTPVPRLDLPPWRRPASRCFAAQPAGVHVPSSVVGAAQARLSSPALVQGEVDTLNTKTWPRSTRPLTSWPGALTARSGTPSPLTSPIRPGPRQNSPPPAGEEAG